MAGERILVVDDRPEGRKLLALRLQHAGYAVTQAASGEAALAMAAASAPDLVLLDVLMPGLDGFATCQRLKALPGMHAVPVVMVTALDSTHDCVRGLEAGADDFIIKPFNPAELQARVRSLLRVKRLFDESQRQQQALAQWSATLEARVAEGAAEVARLSNLKRFFSPRLAARLAGEGGGSIDGVSSGEAAWRSHRGEITVLFADLRGYTAFAEQADSAVLMATLARFHEAMGALIFAAGGTLERFTGDGFMVFFNDPDPQPDHSPRALRLALAMQAESARLAPQWQAVQGPLGLAIGVARGWATLGAVGFASRLDYAAIGPVTNRAARLCQHARSGQVLACPAVRAAAVETEAAGSPAALTFTALPALALKGLPEQLAVFGVQPPAPA